MSNVSILYIDNDSVLQVDNLKDNVNGVFLNAALVTAIISNPQGVAVDGVLWPVSLVYVAGSDGTYRVTLPSTMGMTANGKYLVDIAIDGGPGLKAAYQIECVARNRTKE